MREHLPGFTGVRLLIVAVAWCLIALLLAWWLPFGVTLLLCVVGLALLVRWEVTRFGPPGR